MTEKNRKEMKTKHGLHTGNTMKNCPHCKKDIQRLFSEQSERILKQKIADQNKKAEADTFEGPSRSEQRKRLSRKSDKRLAIDTKPEKSVDSNAANFNDKHITVDKSELNPNRFYRCRIQVVGNPLGRYVAFAQSWGYDCNCSMYQKVGRHSTKLIRKHAKEELSRIAKLPVDSSVREAEDNTLEPIKRKYQYY